MNIHRRLASAPERVSVKSLLAVAVIACSASSAAFACVEPKIAPLSLPNGATASRDEMLAVQKALIRYDAQVKEYGACLDQSGGDRGRWREVMGQLRDFADKFNAELRAFKKRNST